MSYNKRMNLLFLALVFCCCLVSVGYFTLINAMVVEGNVKLKPAVWEVDFTKIQTVKTIGSAQNYQKPKISPKILEFYAEFNEVGDTIIYSIDITNKGTLDAKLDSIDLLPTYSKYLEYECDSLFAGTVLKAGKTIKTNLKIKYVKMNDSINKQSKNIKLVLNWVQDE